jgi:hypothetical protein
LIVVRFLLQTHTLFYLRSRYSLSRSSIVSVLTVYRCDLHS